MYKFVLLFALLAALPAHAGTSLFGAPPLVKAIEANDVDAAKAALLQQPNANMTASGRPVLLLAAEKAGPAMVRLLLENNADINRADRQGNTALMIAAAASRDAVVSVLLDAGASLNKTNQQGMTALMAAAQSGSSECVKLLLAAGANKELADFTGRTALDWAQDSRNAATVRALR